MSADGWLKELTRDLLGMFVPTRETSPELERLEAARAAVRETLTDRNAALERCVETRRRAESLVHDLERATDSGARAQRLATARAGLREAARAESAARAARDAALEAGRAALATGETPPAPAFAPEDRSWEAASRRALAASTTDRG